jgi:hypothetical protein
MSIRNKRRKIMITINNKKFAENENEFIESLFTSQTCVGYARINKKSISILNIQKEKVGVITSNKVLGTAKKLDNGKYWYSYGIPTIIGEFSSYKSQCEEIENIVNNKL